MPEPSEALVAELRRLVLDPLVEQFVEKREILELLALASVAGENLLLVGPPGTAKSQVVMDFAARLEGRYFEYLLTRFSEPNELFGPVDLRKLKEGIVVTNVEGMLPDCEFAFLDEVFNANSAILNSLLNILNERTFRRGRERRTLDLFAVVGATNHLPEDPSLRALFDRFLLRVRCDNVSAASLPMLLEKGWKIELARLRERDGHAAADGRFSVKGLRALCSELASVDLARVKAPYLDLVRKIRSAGISMSDRRVVRLLKVIAASSLFCGRKEASPADFWVLRYIWDNESQSPILEELINHEVRKYLEQAPEPASGGGAVAHPMVANRPRLSVDALAAEVARLAQGLDDRSLTGVELLARRDGLERVRRECDWVVPGDAGQRTALSALTDRVRQVLAEMDARLKPGRAG
ncbi:MAG: AAA family ATPase [Planctomycetes bacterium]|nr:AAA family ATPase [Planctomycetota bacterium]